MNKKQKLEFRGGYKTAYVPVLIFLFFCILFFVVLKAFEMHALAMGALVALLIGALFVKKGQYDQYIDAVYEGAKEAIPVVMLLLVIGMFSQMIKMSNLSGGFVWLASQMAITGASFTAFTFLFVAIIATAAGSSIGTFFTCFPIFYPAGVLLGANPAALAGAIVSGGVLGDNLAPISDTTIISAGTQEYRNGKAVEIGGAVRTRLPYALMAGAFAFILYLIVGGGYNAGQGAEAILMEHMDPLPLIMLIPVVIMLVASVKSGNIYLAITVGLVLGTAIGLITGIFNLSSILTIKEGLPIGYLAEGVQGMMGTSILVLSVYGIMGVLNASGALEHLTDGIYHSELGKTARGTEMAMMIGITLMTILFGGVTSASMTTFGKVQNELGKRANIHPYRRANLLDGFANGLGVAVPFLSVFIFVGSQLTQDYSFVEPIPVTQVALYLFHSYGLFIVFFLSIISGKGRIYEGPNGEEISESAYLKLKKPKAEEIQAS